MVVDEIPAFRYKAALSDFHYDQEALAMSDSKVNGGGKEVPPCHHKRLLESVSDGKGIKTDMMKCCECGALVPRPAQTPASSRPFDYPDR